MSEEPVRTCAACRLRRPQGALVRVVRDPDGTVHVDEGRVRSVGRGAYLCPNDACIALAERRRALRRSLHVEVPKACYDELRRVAAQREQA